MDWGNGSAASTWAAILRKVAHRFVDGHIPGRAAQMSFYFFLSIFPMLVVFVAVIGLFFDAQWLVGDTIMDRVAAVAPPSVARLFTQMLSELGGRSGKPLTWGIVVTLWAASRGMVATINGLNLA